MTNCGREEDDKLYVARIHELFYLGVLKRFSGSRLTGIGIGTDRLIEEPESENPGSSYGTGSNFFNNTGSGSEPEPTGS